MVHSLVQHIAHSSKWVKKVSAARIHQEHIRSIATYRAHGETIRALFEVALVHGLIPLTEVDPLNEALADFENADFVMRMGVLGLFGHLVDTVTEDGSDMAPEVLDDFAALIQKRPLAPLDLGADAGADLH